MRIKSVQAIEKITKAMKMVAASKMKGDLLRLDNGRNFGHGAVDMIFKCDTYMQRKMEPEPMNPSECLVPITSDRGLCGGINSGTIREMRDYIAKRNRDEMSLFVVGEKGTAACTRPYPDILRENVQGLAHPVNYAMSMAIAQKVMKVSKGHDKIIIFYNHFINSLISKSKRVELMGREILGSHEILETLRNGAP